MSAGLAAVPRPALWLGFAGLIPFLFATLLVWTAGDPWNAWAFDALAFYGAVILSFMGAVHWGLAIADHGAPLGEGATWARLGGSVVPPLLAWLALLLNPALGLLLLIVSFAGVFLADVRASAAGLAPAWYPALRKPLTAVVIVALGASYLRAWLGS